MTERVYLDYAATTPLDPQVFEAMQPFLVGALGNPASLHTEGRRAKQAIEEAREAIANLIHANSPEEIVFTSGGSEANNLGTIGALRSLRVMGDTRRQVITTAIEHSSILKALTTFAAWEGYELCALPVDIEGRVKLDALKAAVSEQTALVSVMHASNEVGTLQPICEIAELLQGKNIPFQSDTVQTMGKLPIAVNLTMVNSMGRSASEATEKLTEKTLPVDYLAASAHKFYGPKGVGFLYVRQGSVMPQALVLGGKQEMGLKAGTQNLAGIVGMAEALKLAYSRMDAQQKQLAELKQYFETKLLEQFPSWAVLNGPSDLKQSFPGVVNVSFPGVEGEALVVHLDLAGIAATTGSACNSQEIRPSHVVLAMKGELPNGQAIAQGTVRFSMGCHTTRPEIDRVLSVLPGILKRFEGNMLHKTQAVLGAV